MMNENSFIYRFLCISWVLITVVSRKACSCLSTTKTLLSVRFAAG